MKQAQEIIERACDRFGGYERWQSLQKIEGDILHLGGAVPILKGATRAACRLAAVAVEPQEERATFQFAGGRVLTYERGDILDDGERHGAYRKRFSGLSNKLRMWGPKETAYFFGYALTHYLSLPFSLLPAARHRMVPTVRQIGASGGLDWLDVEYPKGSDTHGRRERLWFDQAGLLKRHDYHAEILGPGFHGAHHSLDYTEVGGLLVAQRRRVMLRIGRWSTPIPVLEAELRLRVPMA